MFSLLNPAADLIVHSTKPFNAEPSLMRLRAAAITPQSNFYVRSHGTIPELDENTHRLRVAGQVEKPFEFSIADLRRHFTVRMVAAVMQCAGNRRADMQRVKPTSGDPWAPGAIGNAKWTGVSLCDVLRAAGAQTTADLHVAFEACDEIRMPDEEPFRYGVSIPITKALSPEVLLAFEMNGEALAPEHGYPLRVVVPGYAGVRSPKWLAAIIVQDKPSENHMQQRDYKLVPAAMTEETVDWEKGVTIYEMPLNSAICEPASFAEMKAGRTTLRGYAIATARDIVRIDVSMNGGRSWHQADFEQDTNAPWSWTFWTATLELPRGEHELTVRAWDSAGQTQPAYPDDVWNFKGYLSAAWHRVHVSAI